MSIRLKWFYRLGFLLLLFIVLYVFMKLKPFWSPVLGVGVKVLIPFAAAAFISYLLHPVVEFLHVKGMSRGLSIVVIYVLFFGGIGFAVYRGIPVIIKQVGELAESAPVVAEQYRGWMKMIEAKTTHWPFGVHERIDEMIALVESKLEALAGTIMSYFLRAFDFFLLIALIPFLAFYFIKDFQAIKKLTWYITPKKFRKQGMSFLRDVDTSLGGYIRGQILVCAAIGLVSAFLFWVVGMEYPLLLGTIIGITNVIPYFGPIIGAVPAVILAASISVKMVIIVGVIVLVLQFLEGNILSPLIVGKSLHMHPVLIMFGLLVGGEVAGVAGLILAVPVLAILKAFVLHAKIHFGKTQSSQFDD